MYYPGLLFPDKWKGIFEELNRDFLRNLGLYVSIEPNGMCLTVLRELTDVIARLFSVKFAKLWILEWLETGGGWEHVPQRGCGFAVLGIFLNPATHRPE